MSKKKIMILLPLLLLLLAAGGGLSAQNTQYVPMDTAVRHGVLPNGLTYYVQANAEPKGRANFYIAQKVGSTLEEENQRGLAHFLEHMAFNGTKHFPGKAMLDYLQRNGIKFGADINAYTSFDETVYNINNVDTSNKNLMDSTLLALYDWSCGILLQDDEIEKERGVINEEWRTRSNANQRMFEAVLPVLFKGSRYADRMPIGLMDVVMHFKPEALRAYYHKWYRPDQQGIIVVGDFNPDKMAEQVKALFSKNPAQRTYSPVPDNEHPVYALFTDPELSRTSVSLMFKHDATPDSLKNTLSNYREDLVGNLVYLMASMRFAELAENPDAPFSMARMSDGRFMVAATKDALTLSAGAKSGKTAETLRLLVTELQRMRTYGFTASELARAKEQLSAMVEAQYNEREKTQTRRVAQLCISNFTRGDALTSIEYDQKEITAMLPEIGLEEVNRYVPERVSEHNIAILVSGPNGEGISYPTEKEAVDIVEAGLKSEVKPYVDEVVSDKLMETIPTPGKIVKEKYNKKLGMTEMKLSNGATVYLKPTNYQDDKIVFYASSKGGSWAYDKFNGREEGITVKMMPIAIKSIKVGGFTRTQLDKVLAAKQVLVAFGMSHTSEFFRGSSIKNDLPTMFQLLNLSFIGISRDDNAFAAMKSRLKSQLTMAKTSPDYIFKDSLSNLRYNGNPLFTTMTAEDVDLINYDKAMEIFKERTENAGDYTFTFVGNFSVDSIRPLIATYIASLPDNGRRDEISHVFRRNPGHNRCAFEQPMKNPKTTIYYSTYGPLKYSLKNRLMMSVLEDVMDIVYTNTIREEEGGTYGVGTAASLSLYEGDWVFTYSFDTSAEKQARLKKRALDELEKVIREGAPADAFAKVKENLLKSYETDQRSNDYWMRMLVNYGLGIDMHTGYEKALRNLTLSDFNKFLRKNLKPDVNTIEVEMLGKESKE
mgnify:CR=1 FL=1